MGVAVRDGAPIVTRNLNMKAHGERTLAASSRVTGAIYGAAALAVAAGTYLVAPEIKEEALIVGSAVTAGGLSIAAIRQFASANEHIQRANLEEQQANESFVVNQEQ